jgi:hypothetical protein
MTILTSHQLAKRLLELPDEVVMVDGGGDLVVAAEASSYSDGKDNSEKACILLELAYE